MSQIDLKVYVGANNAEDETVSDCWLVANELVDKFVGSALVPQVIKDRAYVLVGAEMYYQKKAPNGISQFASYDGQQAVRVARDPMVGAYPILRPWLVLGL